MDKIDPKLTAAKVYPIDRIREEYDEPDEPTASIADPVYLPRDFMIDICGLGFAIAVVVVTIKLLFH